jgi:hypothetical protein
MSLDKDVEQNNLDLLDSLLDKNLSDVEDLPEYLEQCPKGFYRLLVEKVEKKIVEVSVEGASAKVPAPTIQFTYVIEEVLELADATAEPPKVGSKFNESVFFHKDADQAASVIKAKFEEVANAMGWANMKDLIQNLQGTSIGAQVQTNKDKKKDDKYYIQVRNAKVL